MNPEESKISGDDGDWLGMWKTLKNRARTLELLEEGFSQEEEI